MLRKTVYPKVESRLNQIAGFLHQKGFTPNQLTLAGLVLTFITGCIYATGQFFLAGVMLVLSSATDLLDGPLARTSKQVTKFGAFLDSTVDRYADFFLFGGLALFFAKNGQGGWFLVSLGIILGAYVTSYAKARAENLIPQCGVGFFTRAERIILLALGSIIPPLMGIMLWVLLLGTNITALHRILHTKKALEAENQDAA